ncbi:MAG: cation-translocating P-type ATPase [Oscillospiraceae bacterium]|nr:cation-translocating P-type ATPase [Oscillospiraceae bacterium]
MKGLTTQEAHARLRTQGENILTQERPPGPLRIFLRQFGDAMVLILLAATGISALLGEWTDAVTILVIVLLNAVLGFVQEYRTERTLASLRQMTAPTARVYRDGTLQELPAAQLVPGDVVRIEAGDCVPADCLVLSAARLSVNESVLTGESESVEKRAGAPDAPTQGLHLPHLVYSGTAVTRGTGEVRVTATGQATEMGRISGMLSTRQGPTPLQKRLGELGRTLAVLCIAVCIAVFAAGVLRGEPLFEMLMTGISIAIAAIPEGLPATVTIALALAVGRMMKQRALVNRLHSVETLGCTSVICTDKTGTITENRMTVTRLWLPGQSLAVSGTGLRREGHVTENGQPVYPGTDTPLYALLRCGVLCSHAALSPAQDPALWEAVGDPTEVALLVCAAKAGVSGASLRSWKQTAEEPFDSETRCMSVTLRQGASVLTCIKGAQDVVLARCSRVRTESGTVPLTPRLRSAIGEAALSMSEEALRVLAFAQAQDGETVFLGLAGMLDPPRKEARAAVRTCASARIRTVMITGDHSRTAQAIARKAGLLRGGETVTGEELDLMSDEMLRARLPRISVFARVAPAHKLRLVKAFQESGQIVTMTGDGVNDAPAIKAADVGVAMGRSGTDVARQAADVVLMDDDLATLVRAVEEGRCIYANIRKFVRYLLSCNIGEVITMFLGILMGMPVVLLPVQLLLVNLATDGLPAIALGLEPPEPGLMHRPPRDPKESFFAGGLLGRIVWRGILIGLCTLGSFSTCLRFGGDLTQARTAALLTLVLSQLIHVFECKSESGSLLTVRYFSNKKLLGAVLLSVAMLALTVYVPALQPIFSTAPLYGRMLAQAVGFSVAVPILASFRGRG